MLVERDVTVDAYFFVGAASLIFVAFFDYNLCIISLVTAIGSALIGVDTPPGNI